MRVAPRESKRTLLEELLENSMVLVTLDARRPGVEVPPALRNDPRLRLNLSHRFAQPLEITDHGVRAVLTFDGVPFECSLPWGSLYMFVSHATGDPVLFPDDVPIEAVRPEAPTGGDAADAPLAFARSARTKAPAAKKPAAKKAPKPKRARPSHLRVVK